MDGRVQEGIQAQRPAAFEKLTPAEEIVQRRARQRHDEHFNSVSAGALFERLNRIGGQVIGKEVDDQQHQSRPSINMDGNLKRGVTLEKGFH